MSAGTSSTARPVVLRQAGAVLVPAAIWIACGLALVDAVVEGSPAYALRVAVVVAAVSWMAWVVLASPCLQVEREGLRIVNPLRIHWIPFAALDDVLVRGLTSVTVRHASGRLRSITSWNAPGVPRLHSSETASVSVTIERFRAAWEQDHAGDNPAVVTTIWRWRPVLVLLALGGGSIAIWLR